MVNSKTIGIGAIVMAFLIVIVGIPLLTEIADSVFENRNAYSVTDEGEDVTSAIARSSVGVPTFDSSVTFTLDQDNIAQLTLVEHDNGTVLIRNTDYQINLRTGVFNLLNSSTNVGWNDSLVRNLTNFTYTYGDNYVQDSTARVLLGLITIFFVIGILLFLIAKVMGTDLIDLIKNR